MNMAQAYVVIIYTLVCWWNFPVTAQDQKTLSHCTQARYYPRFIIVQFRCDPKLQQMIRISSANYHGRPGSTSCSPVNDVTRVKRYCDGNHDCQLRLPYDGAHPMNQCTQCLTVKYTCVKAVCLQPEVPLFGYLDRSQSTFELGAIVRYSCEPGFVMRGHPSRKCGLVQHIYLGRHMYYRYMWYNVTAPTCIADVSKCPRNAQSRDHPIGTYEGDCYEFVHERRSWQASKDDCRSRNATLITQVSTEAYQSIVDTTPPLNTSFSTFGKVSDGTFWVDIKSSDGLCYAARLHFHDIFGKFSTIKTVECSALNFYICKYTLKPAPACEPLDPVENGLKSTQDTSFGTVVTFTCLYGYRLLGNSNRKCMHNGLWSGDKPKCILIDCGAPPMDNTSRDKMTITYNSKIYLSEVNYTCSDGFYLHGSDVLTCADDGNWTGEAPRCEPFPTTVPPTTTTAETTTPVPRFPHFTRVVTTTAKPFTIEPKQGASTAKTNGSIIAAAVIIPVILCVVAVIVIYCLVKWGLLPLTKRLPPADLSYNGMENPLYATYHGNGQVVGLSNPVYESFENGGNTGTHPTLPASQHPVPVAALLPRMTQYAVSGNDASYPTKVDSCEMYNPVYETLENYNRNKDVKYPTFDPPTQEIACAPARLDSSVSVRDVQMNAGKTEYSAGGQDSPKDPPDTTY